MSAGIPIRIRRTIHEEPIDTVEVGGMMWNLIDQKFGIYNGDRMAWYPAVDPTRQQMIMNAGQRLTGKAANGDTSQVGISFDSVGEMQVVNLTNNAVLARFAADGAVSFANPVVTGVLPGGSYQKVTHPGFVPEMFSTTVLNSNAFTGFVGPNTYLWKRAASSGSIEVKSAYKQGGGSLTHHSAEAYTLEAKVVSAGGPTQNVGLRMWLLDTSLSSDSEFTNNHKFYVSIFGPLNGSNTVRIGRDGVYTEQLVETMGVWQRVAIDIPAHTVASDFMHSQNSPISVDLLYKTSPGTWYLSEPSIQNVDVVPTELYQYRTLAERVANGNAMYWSPPTQRFTETKVRAFNLPTDFPINHAKATYSLSIESTQRPVTVSNKDLDGFYLSSASELEGDWTCKFSVGFHGSLSDIT